MGVGILSAGSQWPHGLDFIVSSYRPKLPCGCCRRRAEVVACLEEISNHMIQESAKLNQMGFLLIH